MQLITSASLLIWTAISGHVVLARPVAAPASNTITVEHTSDGTAIFPTNPSANADLRIQSTTKCITFTSDNPNWQYTNAGPWGQASGTFGSGTKSMCVPLNNDAGGAMFIGTEGTPGPGNTKLEIFLPTSGNAYGDVSLVDGYSLSVRCVSGSAVFGGSTNLWKTGNQCSDTSMLGRNICKNARGYANAQTDVTNFFQQGVKNGNSFCIWKNCAQVPGWPVTNDISCHISGGR
ncbi:MAG: hypothetical protein Q9195_003062 [Heterodermia aff. obscurata]